MPSDQDGMVEASEQPTKLLKKDPAFGFPIAGCATSDISSNGMINKNKKQDLQGFTSMGRTNHSIIIGSSSSSSSSSSNDSSLSIVERREKGGYSKSLGSGTSQVSELNDSSIGSSSSRSSSSSNDSSLSVVERREKGGYSQSLGSRTSQVSDLKTTQYSLFGVRLLFPVHPSFTEATALLYFNIFV